MKAYECKNCGLRSVRFDEQARSYYCDSCRKRHKVIGTHETLKDIVFYLCFFVGSLTGVLAGSWLAFLLISFVIPMVLHWLVDTTPVLELDASTDFEIEKRLQEKAEKYGSMPEFGRQDEDD